MIAVNTMGPAALPSWARRLMPIYLGVIVSIIACFVILLVN